MDAAFRDPKIKQRAQQKLGIIRQGNKDFWDFINKFNQTLLEAGSYDQNDKMKKAWLQNAISIELARVIIVIPEADTYE